MFIKNKLVAFFGIIFFAALNSPDSALAYIGPGAGFAFLGSGFVFILAIALGILTFAFWPLQWLWRKIRGYGVPKNAKTKRVVILGLDGLEPTLVERYISEGKLPNLAALKESGSYSRLGTTLPALSPVAWSTFQTGVNPGAHNIFDFLTRDKRTCLPELASTMTDNTESGFGWGKFRLKRRKSEVRITRKSQPFWHHLGRAGIFSNVVRVPISYPPEPFFGNILSAMCTPDLRGTQGTFSYYSTRFGEPKAEQIGGERYALKSTASGWQGILLGPKDPKSGRELELPFQMTKNGTSQSAIFKIGDSVSTLKLNEFSDWLPVKFQSSAGTIHGIARFCLREFEEHLSLYVSPLNVDPEHPALPISKPMLYSAYLAKKHGSYGTLGLMEDTWGRNEGALDDQRFLDQSYLTHGEREKMFFDALDRTREGMCACVFDASDRIQHMFWRYLDPKHPSPKEKDEFKNTIPEMYQRMDALVGQTQAKLNPDDVLFVISDHGFASFRRCLNLNAWLRQEGYLALKPDAKIGQDYFKDVDWSKTRAFAVGLSGIYLNRQGRERHGIVPEGQVSALKQELSTKLLALRDPADSETPVRKVYDSAKEYRGIYSEEAPDLIVGYAPGYRVSWESVTGGVESDIFSDNLKAWSGDHHVDPEAIPGIFFSNRKLRTTASNGSGVKPNIVDLAPTVLDLFAQKIPRYMEGRALM